VIAKKPGKRQFFCHGGSMSDSNIQPFENNILAKSKSGRQHATVTVTWIIGSIGNLGEGENKEKTGNIQQ